MKPEKVSRLGGFEIVQAQPIGWLGGTAYHMRHSTTGTTYVHIEYPEENAAFNIILRTPAVNSTGISHVLEHAVLDGSKKFGIHNVYREMRKRSLATFMNAMTRPDFTSFIFSTRSQIDFFNLLDVYLDGVFFPLLTEDTFMQECWRYEYTCPSNAASGLRYEGRVLNEMKSTIGKDSFITRLALGRGLYPGTPFAENFGGDPAEMVKLSRDDIVEYHRQYYHPSNAVFISAGSISVRNVAQKLNALISFHFDRSQTPAPIWDADPFTEPRMLSLPTPASPLNPEKSGQTILAWGGRDLTGAAEPRLLFAVITNLLLGHPLAPLRTALLEHGLGLDMTSVSGLVGLFRHITFAAGVRGWETTKGAYLQDILLERLTEVRRSGFNRSDLERIWARLEFELLERRPLHSLYLVMKPVRAALEGLNPLAVLDVESTLRTVRAEVLRRGFLEELIQLNLLDNLHRCLITLVPDENFFEQIESQEKLALREAERHLSPQQKRGVVNGAQRLLARQSLEIPSKVLPEVPLSEVSASLEDPDFQVRDLGGAWLYIHPLEARSNTQIHFAFDFSWLPQELKKWIPIFARALPHLPFEGQSRSETMWHTDSEAGDVGTTIRVIRSAKGESHGEWLTISGKSLERRRDNLLGFLDALIKNVIIDWPIIIDTALRMHHEIVRKLPWEGVSYAQLLAHARLHTWAAAAERLHGLSFVRELRQLATPDPIRIPVLRADIEWVARHIFARDRLSICVASSEPGLLEFASRVAAMVDSMSMGPTLPEELPSAPTGKSEAGILESVPHPIHVAAFETVPYEHQDAAALSVLAHYLRQNIRWEVLGDNGGAWADPQGGVFSLVSWNDGRLSDSYATLAEVVNRILCDEGHPAALTRAIIHACHSVPPSVDPVQHSWALRRQGYTLEKRRTFRERVLATTAADLRRVAETYLSTEPVRVTIGRKAAIDAALRNNPNLFDSVSPIWS